MYGVPSAHPRLSWSWVDDQLAGSGTYWIVARGVAHPHPRPVWGIWRDHRLHLSIGSTVITRQLERTPDVTVHLDSGVDVVIVEGHTTGPTEAAALYDAYDEKYDWSYSTDEYGPLTTIVPSTVLAWRSAGWAGREGFQETGRWGFD
jgi:hypothetical protein